MAELLSRVAIALVFLAPLAAQTPQIRLTQIATGLGAPTDIQNAGDGTNRLFLVQQNGIIRLYKNGAVVPTPFLDIDAKTNGGGERGLLGMAFPPGYAGKQRFYVNYTDLSGNTVIAMYRASAGNPDVADPTSEQILLEINQPGSNHNGGSMRFGPDGFLYVATGDGGGGTPEQAQHPQSLLGKILRLDVESQPGTVLIPPGNPFTGLGGNLIRPEIWASGLRNPWRISFDRATGDLWIADVGQDEWEEVNFQLAASSGGQNYGWPNTEGNHCYQAAPCNMQGYVPPVAEYSHTTSGCSVTGGYRYRGALSPDLTGIYFYGDFCSGRIWGLRQQNGQWVNQQLLQSGLRIMTFGEDEAGEIYVADGNLGGIHRIETAPAEVSVTITSTPPGRPFTLDTETTPRSTPQTLSFATGSTHTITWLPVPSLNGTRHVFEGWVDGGTANPRQITANATATYEGIFSTAHQVSLSLNGSGTVTLQPPSADGFYAQGSTVQATAVPTAGSTFAGYSGCTAATGLIASFPVVQPCTLTATLLPDQPPPLPTALLFVPVTPCRLMDTRDPAKTGSLGPPALAAQTQRTVAVLQGTCSIPATARAYALNVTVVPAGPLSFLTLWPAGFPRPLASTLNSPAGQVVANAALMPAGTNGDINVFVTDATDVILDIVGYFVGGSN
jgi:glucose/arabinose dehydrogenase